jgi:hypothetical protein
VCNLYSMTKSQAAIRELTRAMFDRTGNLPPLGLARHEDQWPIPPPPLNSL